jgi:hypothetical protein
MPESIAPASQVVWLVLACAACQGGESESGTAATTTGATAGKTAASGSEASGAAIGDVGSGSAVAPAEPDDDGSARAKPDEVDVPDVGKAIADLGAVAAWQAVVDRSRYLTRRGVHGVVFGKVGSTIEVSGGGDAGMLATPYTWLIDDTEGNGALAIRVALGPKAGDVKAGERVALGGAWALDGAHTWFWKADDVSPLPVATNDSKDPRFAPVPPGHVIGNGDLPSGAKPITKADEGDAAWFQLVGAPPASDGDGWPVADELGNPVYALLDLPGEHASYGAQDMRTADERWQLKRGSTYVVRIGPVHRHGSDKPATIRARTAPIRVK